ncbi:SCP2 domain-containing protein [Psychromonas sp. RZ22]|uniref:ubiquinone anaerobic biosynthesis accessory factor UbiT n=1 Tax=Psychromonas algarum TaxID=2555643 RepID=UPI00106863EA|nr:SCP2 sterol-binding domain-containing protein [Psychromonas sp. RZ22]TEW56060.1 SCP2 domain-containing protein [Psychromonas sp. RZ22]
MFTQLRSEIQHKIVTKTPKLLAFPSLLLPFSVQQKCLNEILSRIFKEAIEDDDLRFLEDKWLKVTISDLKLTWFLSFENDAIVIKEKAPRTDVSFTAVVNDLILVVGRKEDPDTLFFQRRLSIEGDTELGLEVKNLLDNIEFDNLPPLAQKTIAHFSEFIKTGLALKPTGFDKVTNNVSV